MVEYLLKLADRLIGGLLQKWREQRALQREFETIRRRILYVGLLNDLPVELHALRAFLIENDLVEIPGIHEFFDRWLTDPVVVIGRPAVGAFRESGVAEMMEQLASLKL